MFNHLLNDVIHYWLQYPESSLEDTILFLVSDKALTPLDEATSELASWLEEQREIFSNRAVSVKDWIDDLPEEQSPLLSNPYMENFGGDEYG